MKVCVKKIRADVGYWYGSKIGRNYEVVCENHEVDKLATLKESPTDQAPIWMSELDASYVVEIGGTSRWGIILKEDCEIVPEVVFQSGDSLRCIDNEGVNILTIGEIYECSSVNSQYVWVKCNHEYFPAVGFGHDRFEKVVYENAYSGEYTTDEAPVWNDAVSYKQGEQIAFPEIEKLFEQAANTEAEQKTIPKNNKYLREIKPGVFVDVYDVLRAFNVTDPCLQHLAKKALCAGLRGHKDRSEDLKDILASAQRAIEMHYERSEK